MKSEVVLIAKFYRVFDAIEWVRHYEKLGFDHITIYNNDTECFDVTALEAVFPNLTVCRVTGRIEQCEIYNTHRKQHKEYDWIFFCDDDEFLYLDRSKFANINEFLRGIPPFMTQFGVWWKYMSYANGEVPEDRMFGRVTEEMVYTDNEPYLTHLKVFVHKDETGVFCIPHRIGSADIWTIEGQALDVMTIRNPINDYICLHHYYRRSKKETEEKMERNRIDAGGQYKDHPEQNGYESDHKYNVLDSRILL